MTFQLIDEAALFTGRQGGYAMDALAFGKANEGKWFQLEPKTSPNAAGRLRQLGLTVKTHVNSHKEQRTVEGVEKMVTVFDSVDLQCRYTNDSKEAQAARAAAANPKPKAKKAKAGATKAGK